MEVDFRKTRLSATSKAVPVTGLPPEAGFDPISGSCRFQFLTNQGLGREGKEWVVIQSVIGLVVVCRWKRRCIGDEGRPVVGPVGIGGEK